MDILAFIANIRDSKDDNILNNDIGVTCW